MILKELFDKCKFEDVFEKILEFYPEEITNKDGYSKVLNSLKNMEPDFSVDEDEGPLIVYVYKVWDVIRQNHSYESVSGYSEKQKTSYACEFMSYNKWLAMEVAEPSLKYYGLNTFLAYILWEMTFVSFDESEIKEQSDLLKEMEKSIDEELDKGKSNFKTISIKEISQNIDIQKTEMPDKKYIELINKKNLDFERKMLGLDT